MDIFHFGELVILPPRFMSDIVTYDGLRYSCQGQGDHILAKSLDSGFELQGKFKKPFDNSIKGVTVMTGFHLRTGNPNEPDVEFDISTLRRKWWIGGQSVSHLLVDNKQNPGSVPNFFVLLFNQRTTGLIGTMVNLAPKLLVHHISTTLSPAVFACFTIQSPGFS